MFSGIKRKIIIANLFGWPLIFIALLIIDAERTRLIDLKIQALTQQAETISSILTEKSSGRYHKNKLSRFVKGQKDIFSIHQAILGDDIDALLFNNKGIIIEDSRQHLPGKITIMPLNDISTQYRYKTRYQILYERAFKLLYKSNMTDYILFNDNNEGLYGADFIEFKNAVIGKKTAALRINKHHQTTLSVAVPVRRLGKVLGVLKLSSSSQTIINALIKERQMLVKFFVISVLLSLLISYFLAKRIAKPLIKLTNNIQIAKQSNFRPNLLQNINVRKLTKRNDEIGILSQAFEQLMSNLTSHFNDIENFAADVAHELKNPLTSLNSAINIVENIKDNTKKSQLFSVIKHDIKRIDRLIGDISNLSRINAEMHREDYEKIDLKAMLNDLISHYQQGALAKSVTINFHCTENHIYYVGIAERLGCVFNNIIANGLSFLQNKQGMIDVFLTQENNHIIIKIQDNGVGIANNEFDKIFNRFYSDRPNDKSFGNHSGIGLAVVKQIIESHNGTIKAYNRNDGISGAIFEIKLIDILSP